MRKLYIHAQSIVRPQLEDNWKDEIPKQMKLRSPRIWRMAQVATQRIVDKYNTHPASLIVSTALGALDETKNFLNGIFEDGFGSPRNFIASVHNSMAGTLALNFKIKGPNLTICDGQNSFASAIVATSILTLNDFPVLFVAVDERIRLLDDLHTNFSAPCKTYLKESWEEAAVAFIISDKKDNAHASINASSPVPTLPNDITTTIKNIGKSLGVTNIVDPTKCSDSYLSPALTAYEIIESRATQDIGISGYSPTAQAVSLVALCV